MKTVARVVAAVAAISFAVPALACGDAKTTSASAEKDQGKAKVASSEKAPAQAQGTVKTAPAAR